MNLTLRPLAFPSVRALTWALAGLTALLYVVVFSAGCPKIEDAPGSENEPDNDPITEPDVDDETCVAEDAACDEDRPCCAGTYCALWANAYLEDPHACVALHQNGAYCGESSECASGECVDHVCGGAVEPVEPEPEPICAAEGQTCSTVTCCDGLVCVANADTAFCEAQEIEPTCAEQSETCANGETCCDGLGCFNGTCVTAPASCESEWDCDGAPCTEGHCDVCGQDGDTCYGTGGCCDGQYCALTGYIEGSCEPKVPVGGVCIFWESCQDGLFCDDGTCASLVDEGAACFADAMCTSQYCLDETCAPRLSPGAACIASHHCTSGACIDGQCQ